MVAGINFKQSHHLKHQINLDVQWEGLNNFVPNTKKINKNSSLILFQKYAYIKTT